MEEVVDKSHSIENIKSDLTLLYKTISFTTFANYER